MEDYIQKKKNLQSNLLEYIDNEENVEENYSNLVQIIKDQKIQDNYSEIKLLFNMITKISNYHHRSPNFFDKITKVILIFQDLNLFSNTEIYQIFNSNKRILLFLLEENILKLNYSISKKISLNINDFYYFYPELTSYNESMFHCIIKNCNSELIKYIKSFPDEFNNLRKNGENESYICQLIRKDDIRNFISFINQNFISIESYMIKESIYETNQLFSLLSIKNDNNRENYLIEYAAFCGSIQIFNYLLLNGAKLMPSIMIYAIHGCNPEIIHILEEKISLDKKEEFLMYSIMFFENEMTNYILNNYFENKESISFNESIKYFNFSFFPKKITDFVELCKNGYLTVIEFLYKSKSFDDDLIFNDDLVDAVLKNNHFDIFKFLFEMKPKKSKKSLKNDKEYDINKILYNAVENENVKAVEYLLSKSGIDINYYYEHTNKNLNTYHYFNSIPKQKQKQIDDVLKNVENKPLEKDERERNINKSYMTVLQLAASKGNNEIISLLLNIPNININDQLVNKNYFHYYNDADHGPDVEVSTKIRTMKSALIIAIENNDIEDVELLIKNPKIDVNSTLINEYFYEYDFSDRRNREYAGDVQNEAETKTALYLAIEQNNVKIVELLLSKPEIDVNRPSKLILNVNDIVDLFKSIESDTVEFYPYENGVIPELEEDKPIELAETMNNIEIISLLLSNPNINADPNEYLADAIKSGNINAYNSILSNNKFNANEAFKGALHKAVMTGNIDMVNELLNRPEIDVNSVFDNLTAIQIAAQSGNIEVFKALLNKPEIDVNTIYFGSTPIVIAAQNNYTEIFNILINHPKIDIKYLFSGQLALNEAAEKGNLDIFKVLFEKPEIDVNFHYQEGYTALHCAVLGGNVEIVKMLLFRPEIDVNVMSHCKTAFQIAVELKNLEIVQIFLERSDVQFDPDTIFPNLDSDQMKIFFLSLSHRKKIESPEKKEIWNQLEEEFYFYFFNNFKI